MGRPPSGGVRQDVTLEEVPDMETETTCAREEDVDLLPPAADFTFAVTRLSHSLGGGLHQCGKQPSCCFCR